jgi:3alpha(or 20beta)-hydroxysteroid dehydrogenase
MSANSSKGQRDGRLHGKVAIVSGAAQGMGAATARVFCEEGARVVLLDVQAERGAALAAELRPNAAFVHGDVREQADWARTAALAAEQFGPVSVLVNNAGIWNIAALPVLTRSNLQEILDVNLLGVIFGMQAVFPVMRDRGGGSIINISSVAGLQGTNGLAAYCASKWAVRGVTKVAALEFGPHRIRVNSIQPGGVDTPMSNPAGVARSVLDGLLPHVPLQRMAGPEEIARATLFLASDDSSYVNGAELTVDGGWSAGDYEPSQPGAPPRN